MGVQLCVQSVEDGQQTVLWGASAERDGGGVVGANLDCLWAVCEDVSYPGTDG